MKIFKYLKIITKVIHWCKLFKSKMTGPDPDPPVARENTPNEGYKKGSVLMKDFFIKLCSGRFKKVVREQVTPLLRKTAGETKNEFDKVVVSYLEETFKPEPKPEPETEPENEA